VWGIINEQLYALSSFSRNFGRVTLQCLGDGSKHLSCGQ
jgi:hypothetical protein